MKQYPVVKLVFLDSHGQCTNFFLSEGLAYRFGKQHHFTIANISPEMISDVEYRMLFT